MTYRLGVDVGGTFTDVLLVEESTGETWRAKTASTPSDQSVGVLNGINQVCDAAEISLAEVAQVLHGTTVATNAILEGKGARVGLVTTKGFRQVLQIARSFVPGGLAGWIIWPKPEPLAALENTVEVDERVGSDGTVIRELDEDDVRAQLAKLATGRRGARRLADQLLRRTRPRAAHRRDRRRGAARRAGLAVLGRAARDARVRTHRDHGRQRLRAAPGRAATSRTLGEQLHEGGITGELRDPAQRRRAVGRRDRHHLAGDDAALRPGRRGDRRGVDRRAVRLPRPDHLRHGRHLHRHRARAGPVAAHRPRDQGRRPDRARASVDVRTVGAGGGSIAQSPS